MLPIGLEMTHTIGKVWPGCIAQRPFATLSVPTCAVSQSR